MIPKTLLDILKWKITSKRPKWPTTLPLTSTDIPPQKITSNENIYSCEMKSWDTKINLEKSNRSVRRGAEHTEVREHPRTYKDDAANFSGRKSIVNSVGFAYKEREAKPITNRRATSNDVRQVLIN
ncbi:RPE5 domain protein [Rickettsia endosymbiont of Ixodes pacificus]|nr:RPE5 domain protein [Rickettsia endosymbiont of Ixodes pacificus]